MGSLLPGGDVLCSQKSLLFFLKRFVYIVAINCEYNDFLKMIHNGLTVLKWICGRWIMRDMDNTMLYFSVFAQCGCVWIQKEKVVYVYKCICVFLF